MKHMPHIHTVPHKHDFDCTDITTEMKYDITMRHYDYAQWCKSRALGAYFIDNKYNTNGITVGFELERDYEHFLVFCDDYWIFMHD